MTIKMVLSVDKFEISNNHDVCKRQIVQYFSAHWGILAFLILPRVFSNNNQIHVV